MDLTQTRSDVLLQAALDGLAARQRVISNNVANVDTPGFKASQVTFEGALRRAMGIEDGGLPLAKVQHGLAGPDDQLADLTPVVVQSNQVTRRVDGNNVDIDQQMVELAETNITYNALAQLTGARLQLLRSVINDGRR